MKQTKPAAPIHPNLLGKYLEDVLTLPGLTTRYNQYRKSTGKQPVQQMTVARYNNSGSHYKVAPPVNYTDFLISQIARK